MRYFAYGSNMLTARLAARVRGPRPLATARLAGHRLCFHKRGRDESGKADALRTGEAADVVWGVVFEIGSNDRPRLDDHEGAPLHYEPAAVSVEAGRSVLEVLTYFATPAFQEEGLRPFSWYKALVLAGALEHGLPEAYVARIEAEPHLEDPDPARDALERSVLRPPS